MALWKRNVLEYWTSELPRLRAGWFHDGDVRRPHVCMDNGHRGGFVQLERLVTNPIALNAAAVDLVELLRPHVQLTTVVRVVGYVGLDSLLASAVARVISQGRNQPVCRSAYCERSGSGPQSMLHFDTTPLSGGEVVILVTTLFCHGILSELSTLRNIITAGGNVVLPFTLCLVNTKLADVYEGQRVVFLVHKEEEIWSGDSCGLCQAGSPAIPFVGDDRMWGELTKMLPKVKIPKLSEKGKEVSPPKPPRAEDDSEKV